MLRRSHAWIGGGLLLMAVATLFWVEAFLGDGTAPSTAAADSGWAWRPGQTNHYRLAFESRLSLGEGVVVQRIKSELFIQVESLTEDEVTLRARLLDPELGGALAREPGLSQALASDFRLVMGRQGDYRRVRSAGDSPRAMRVVEALLGPLTCELSGSAERWHRSEQHLGQEVAARYRQLGPRSIKKVLMRTGMGAGSASRLQHLEHRARYRQSETAAWLEFAHVRERATLGLPGGAKARSSMELTLRALPAGLARTTLPAAARTHLSTSPVVITPTRDEASPPSRVRASEADRRRLLALLDRLLSTEQLDPSVLQQLESLLREYPELALLVPERVRPGISDQGSAQLLHLLELVGHPQCQTALCDIAASPKQDRRECLRALVALGGLAQPTPKSIARLQALSAWSPTKGESASTALLALGALGPRLADRKQSRAIQRWLSGRLRASVDVDEGLALIDAMANNADPSLVGSVALRLDDRSARLRRQAAQALSKFPGRRSEEHLLRVLATSQDKALRGAAAASLGQRARIEASTRSATMLRMRAEADPAVRLGLARVLARELRTHPELRANLRQALERETDDRVRKVLLEGFLRSPGGLPHR